MNCRASVLSFLVNATDIRDECDGLHGAFASSCVEEAPADASPLAETHRFLAAKKDPGHVIVTRQDRKRLRQQRNARKRQKQHDLECCRSVVRVYHERCDDRTAEDLTDRNLLVIVLVLCLCGFVRSAIRRFEVHCLPEVAGCILVGVAGGILVHLVPGYSFSFDEHLFLRVLLPPIVFEATLSIDKRAFRRHVVPILGYAILGTIFSSGLVAIILRTEGTLPWVDSLAFGTLISSIDPVATLAVLNAIGIDETETLYILIFGEALLNDGVAVVLFENLVSFMDDSVTVDSNIILHAVLDFFKVALGSCLVGVIAGIFCTLYFRAVKGWQTPLIEVLLFFLWSLIPYYVCDEIKWSGIVSIVVMGFIMDMYVIGSEAKDFSLPHSLRHARPLLYSRGCLSETGTRHVRFVVEVISTLMETTIFAYLGLFMFSSRFHWDLTLVLLACLGCILSRGVMVLLLTSLLNGAEACRHHLAVRTAPPGDADASLAERRQRLVIDRRTQAVLFYSGLRGAMSFALVENIPFYDVVTGRGSRYKPELKAMTSSAIFVTIFLFGGSTFHLLQRLGFAGREREGRLGEEEAAAKVHRSMEEE
uniref:Cation/H+ exchanger transmembrane domain-containing protein n=1 Tax=Corethron hystrix TaxID=216773 RepID=A0A7S1FML1_9STRA